MDPNEAITLLEQEKKETIDRFYRAPESLHREIQRTKGQKMMEASFEAIRWANNIDRQIRWIYEVSENGSKGKVNLHNIWKHGKPRIADLDDILKQVRIPNDIELGFPFYIKVIGPSDYNLISPSHVQKIKNIVHEKVAINMLEDAAYQNKISNLKKKHEEASSLLQQSIADIEGKRITIENYLASFPGPVTEEKRMDIRYYRKPFHSLWSGDSPVLMVKQNYVYMLSSEAMTKPYKAQKIPLSDIFSRRSQEALISIGVPLNTAGGFMITSGKEINDTPLVYRMFSRVLGGHEIYPGTFSERTRTRSEEPKEPYLEHLRSLGPTNETDGKVVMKTLPTRAFYLGGKVVDEPLGGQAATYVFERDFYDNRETLERKTLRREKPEGLLGIIFHTDFPHWEANLAKRLAP